MQKMTRRGFLGAAGIAAVVPTRSAIAAQSGGSSRGSVSIEKNIVFGKAGNTELRLDIYKPAGTADKRMAMIRDCPFLFSVGIVFEPLRWALRLPKGGFWWNV